MKTGLFLASVLPLLAAASPLVERAGGPIAKPIPSTCTVTNPVPTPNGIMPNPSFVKANLLYQAYYETSGSAKQQALQCAEQCYGYGTPGQCKSSFFAKKVPVPAGYYGTSGGELENGCLLFKADLTPDSFVIAKKGTYVKASAADISCPS